MPHAPHVPSVFAAHVQQAAHNGGDDGGGAEKRGVGGVNAAQCTARKARERLTNTDDRCVQWTSTNAGVTYADVC